MIKKMDISIVIPTYNRPLDFKRCLESISLNCLLPKEIIVVDESEDDIIKELCEKSNISYLIRYFKNPGKGQGSARNYGVEQSNGKIILFLDSDVYSGKNLIKKHLEAHKEGKLCVLGNIRFPVGQNVDFYNKNTDLAYYFQDIKEEYVNFIKFITANISIRKDLFLKSGGFDTSFTKYGFEDLELGYRIFGKEKKIYFKQDAIGYHYNKRSLRQIEDRAKKVAKASLKFYIKHCQYYNQFLLPVQRLISSLREKEKKINNNNFKEQIEIIMENTIRDEINNIVDKKDINNINNKLNKYNFVINEMFMKEVAILSKYYNLRIPVLKNDFFGIFLKNYKYKVKSKKYIFINNAKNKTVTLYSCVLNNNIGTCSLPIFLITIIKNRFKFKMYFKSRLKKILQSIFSVYL